VRAGVCNSNHWRLLFNAGEKKGEFLRPRFAIEAAIQIFYQVNLFLPGKKHTHFCERGCNPKKIQVIFFSDKRGCNPKKIQAIFF
jgi:hypothetical protein